MTHPSNLPHAIERATGNRKLQSVVHYGQRPIFQGGELNDAQAIARERARRNSNLVAADGDRISGAAAIVDVDAGTVTLEAGEIYVAGDVLEVAGATLADVSMLGQVRIGVRLVTSWITHEDDPELMGQVPGAPSEGEPGAAREIAEIAWATSDDGGEGQFAQVYLLQDGTILDQTPPPVLEGVSNALAVYDYAAHGHYVVDGCRVTALGKAGNDQVFSIEQGEANARGRKITRHAALRFAHTEDWQTRAVPGETHSFGDGASTTVLTAFSPIAAVTNILLTKQKTEAVTRGATASGADGLSENSVISVVEVTQSATTFVEDTDFSLVGNNIDWAPAGAEPATGSSYNVTYLYRESVVPDSFTDTEIVVSGGVDDEDIIIAYTYKLPRIDLLCLDQQGRPQYVTGISDSPLAPPAPRDLLKLAEVHNSWAATPKVKNNSTFNQTFDEAANVKEALEDLTRIVMILRAETSIDLREPVAKKNMFTDPLVDDNYRDDGVAQTAAIGGGMMQLAIAETFYATPLTAPVTLDFEEEIIIRQEQATSCVKINPYQNFTPLPGALALTPAADFWTETQTEWASDVTQEFNRGVRWDGAALQTVSQSTNTLSTREEQAEFLRQIDVVARIEGLAEGEILDSLTFDGIDVLTGGPHVGDVDGIVEVTFTIPANVTTGSKAVLAEGAGGTKASALFVGEGIINVDVMQRVTTISRWTAGWFLDGEAADGQDPQAQSFTPQETRQIIGVDFKICAVGDETNNILIHQVSMENGDPTIDVQAEAFVPMAGASEGWVSARYSLPTLTENDRQTAFVIKTDDADHSISTAELGDFDVDTQTRITEHPYPIGVRHSSVNARSWDHHQKSACTFRLIAAKYTSLEKIIDLGTHDLVDCSDLQVRAATLIPSGDCSVTFEIERANGDIHEMQPMQVIQLKEYITETVQLRAVLRGTEKLSPVLYAPVVLIAGKLATSGTYVTRAFNLGADVRLTEYFKAHLPGGSTITVEYDLADDNFQLLPQVEIEALADPNWIEAKHEVTNLTAVQGRLKLTLNGTPAARPLLGDLGAAVF